MITYFDSMLYRVLGVKHRYGHYQTKNRPRTLSHRGLFGREMLQNDRIQQLTVYMQASINFISVHRLCYSILDPQNGALSKVKLKKDLALVPRQRMS